MTTAADAGPMLLTYKYRLNPEKRQHRVLERILEQQRQLYNAALEERIDAWRKSGRTITEVDQSRSLTVIRADDPAYAGTQRRIQRETLRRLDRAYKGFFRRAKSGAGASSGFPRFKGAHFFDGFGFDAFAQIKFDGTGLRFAGMPGTLRLFVDRPLPKVRHPDTGELVTDIRNVWFKREGKRWFVGFQAATPVREDRRGLGTGETGVDWGTSVLAALSSGETVPNPRHGEALAAELRRAQRAVARTRKGSSGRREAIDRLRAVHARIANRRCTHLDKVASRLVKHFGLVAVEDLAVQRLMDAERPGDAFRRSRLLDRIIPAIHDVLAAGGIDPPADAPEGVEPVLPVDEVRDHDEGHRRRA
jgi:putative transposase